MALSNTAKGQVLKGVVADAESGETLFPVTVVNLSTQESTYSNKMGEFSISAKNGDQIMFSFIGYETVKRPMPPTLNIANIRVDMKLQNYQLQNVLVRGLTKYQKDSIERRATYIRTLSRQKTTTIMSPVSLLAERLSKRSKQIYNFQKSFNYWEGQRFIDSRYTPELVNTLTGLTNDSLAHFMNAYPMPQDYARSATELELKMWIRYNYKQWVARSQQVADSTRKE